MVGVGVCLFLAVSISAEGSAELSALWPDAGELETFLKEAEVVARRKLGEGVTNPEKITLEQGGVVRNAVFKQVDSSFDSWRFEIAAYRMDRLLGLGMVPPTVERRFGGKLGCLQLWVEGVTMDRLTSPPSDLDAWRRQVSLMWLFDDLIGNIDRHTHNVIVTPEFRLVLIDNSKTFSANRDLLNDLNRGGSSGTRALFWWTEFDERNESYATRYPSRLLTLLENLSKQEVKNAVGRYLKGYDRKVLLERRNLILHRLEEIGRPTTGERGSQ